MDEKHRGQPNWAFCGFLLSHDVDSSGNKRVVRRMMGMQAGPTKISLAGIRTERDKPRAKWMARWQWPGKQMRKLYAAARRSHGTTHSHQPIGQPRLGLSLSRFSVALRTLFDEGVVPYLTDHSTVPEKRRNTTFLGQHGQLRLMMLCV
jgi:hypothetical protein